MDISLAPQIIFEVAGFPVTNTMFWSMVVAFFMVLVMAWLRYSMKTVPGRLQALSEIVLEGGFGFVEQITGDKKKTKRIFPLVFTMFLFIMVANFFAFIPGAAVTIDGPDGTVGLFRSAMSDYGMVLVLTSISVILVQIIAIAVNGPVGYIGKFFNFKNLFKNPKSLPLDLFLGFMDLISEFAKVLSLSFRLFGNIFAGEVLTIVMLSLMPYFAPLPFMFLGLLTAIVQAFVFSVLTLVFISMASEKEEN